MISIVPSRLYRNFHCFRPIVPNFPLFLIKLNFSKKLKLAKETTLKLAKIVLFTSGFFPNCSKLWQQSAERKIFCESFIGKERIPILSEIGHLLTTGHLLAYLPYCQKIFNFWGTKIQFWANFELKMYVNFLKSEN